MGTAGISDHPITIAPLTSPVTRFAEPGVPVCVVAGAELEAVALARMDDATDAGMVDVAVKVLAPPFESVAVVVVGSELGFEGEPDEGGGGGVLLVSLPPEPPPEPPLETKAGFPPIALLEMSSARRSDLVSMKTPRGPATMSAWNCTVRSLSRGWFVLVTYTKTRPSIPSGTMQLLRGCAMEAWAPPTIIWQVKFYRTSVNGRDKS